MTHALVQPRAQPVHHARTLQQLQRQHVPSPNRWQLSEAYSESSLCRSPSLASRVSPAALQLSGGPSPVVDLDAHGRPAGPSDRSITLRTQACLPAPPSGVRRVLLSPQDEAACAGPEAAPAPQLFPASVRSPWSMRRPRALSVLAGSTVGLLGGRSPLRNPAAKSGARPGEP